MGAHGEEERGRTGAAGQARWRELELVGAFLLKQTPDHVHVLYKGRIVKSAGKELALELEEKGYDWIKKEFED